MRRRDFIRIIAGSVACWPLAVSAQQSVMPVVGFLSGRSLASDAHLVKAFQEGLAEAGYVEGRNVLIDFRWAEAQADRFSALAASLVERKVTVIFAGAIDVEIQRLKVELPAIPIVVATGGDPVALGLVASLARPGGNITGVTVITDVLWPKRLELLRELIGQDRLIGILNDPDNLTAALATKAVEKAAHDLGQKIILVNARAEIDFEPAFATMAREQVGALLVPDGPVFINSREALVALAASRAIPAMYGRREFPASGGLMSYGASTTEQYRQSGIYVGRILSGAKPAELPFLQPTKYEMVINLKTAKALGLTVPPILHAIADEVIE